MKLLSELVPMPRSCARSNQRSWGAVFFWKYYSHTHRNGLSPVCRLNLTEERQPNFWHPSGMLASFA
jgi:hypothetical protein